MFYSYYIEDEYPISKTFEIYLKDPKYKMVVKIYFNKISFRLGYKNNQKSQGFGFCVTPENCKEVFDECKQDPWCYRDPVTKGFLQKYVLREFYNKAYRIYKIVTNKREW